MRVLLQIQYKCVCVCVCNEYIIYNTAGNIITIISIIIIIIVFCVKYGMACCLSYFKSADFTMYRPGTT